MDENKHDMVNLVRRMENIEKKTISGGYKKSRRR
jgi:hypothetical protein